MLAWSHDAFVSKQSKGNRFSWSSPPGTLYATHPCPTATRMKHLGDGLFRTLRHVSKHGFAEIQPSPFLHSSFKHVPPGTHANSVDCSKRSLSRLRGKLPSSFSNGCRHSRDSCGVPWRADLFTFEPVLSSSVRPKLRNHLTWSLQTDQSPVRPPQSPLLSLERCFVVAAGCSVALAFPFSRGRGCVTPPRQGISCPASIWLVTPLTLFVTLSRHFLATCSCPNISHFTIVKNSKRGF